MLAGVENGETFVAHKGEPVKRKTDRQFYKRLGGGFEKIIRKGSNPTNYYWIVTDKGGTKYYYRGIDKVDTNAVLKGITANGQENIAQWYLVRVEDVQGNTVNYHYESKDAKPFNGLVAKVVYCTSIDYTGYKGQKGAYTVEFVRNSNFKRKDKRTNAKVGFLTMVSDELSEIKVNYLDQKVRTYKFKYREGAFYKTLLDKVTQYDADGEEFYSHKLEYYEDIEKNGMYNPFSEGKNVLSGNTSIKGGLINPVSKYIGGIFTDDIPALGGGVSKNSGYSIYAGIGADPTHDVATKNNTVGGHYGNSKTKTEQKVTIIDINGDGLPDKVYKQGGVLWYIPNISKMVRLNFLMINL